jgi:hypothetical protein
MMYRRYENLTCEDIPVILAGARTRAEADWCCLLLGDLIKSSPDIATQTDACDDRLSSSLPANAVGGSYIQQP